MNNVNTKKSNKNKKKGIVALVLTFAVIIGGAFAFLTAQDSKTNVFTIGNVDIELQEPSWYDENDNVIGDENNNGTPDRAENMVPGQVEEKDPQVKNTGKNPAYIIATVAVPTVPEADVIQAANGDITVSNGEKQIDVKAYAFQEGYEGKDDAEEIWNAFTENGAKYEELFGASVEDNGIELIDTFVTDEDGNIPEEDAEHFNSNAWALVGEPYKTAEYTYYIYKYTPGILDVDDTTETIFDVIKLNEEIGKVGYATVRVNYKNVIYEIKVDAGQSITTEQITNALNISMADLRIEDDTTASGVVAGETYSIKLVPAPY